MNDSDRLAEELRRQARARAGSVPDQHPLTLDDVRGRARGIRRRRYAVTGLAAAAVVAVTVPLGLTVGDRLDRTPTHGPADGPTAHRTDTVGPTPTPTPEPTVPRRLALTSDVPQAASAVAVPYLNGKTLYPADGEKVSVDRRYDVLLRLGSGYLAGYQGASTSYLDSSGTATSTEASTGGPVVSPSGRMGAYTSQDGRTVTVDASGRTQPLMTSPRRSGEYQVAAMTDDGGSCEATGTSCTVWSNSLQTLTALTQSTTVTPGKGVPTHGEKIGDVPAHVEAVSLTGDLAETVSADAAGACSAVVGPVGRQRWRTCEWTLGAFSPDGRYVLGEAVGDGRGPRAVALLDARTGDVLREFAARGTADVFVHQVVWEGPDVVLATVWDVDHWAVLRLAVSGLRETVGAYGIRGAHDPDAAPVVLAGPVG